MNDISTMHFEQAYAELETLVQQIEAGNLTLDDTLDLYDRGLQLSSHCQHLLSSAQLRVSRIEDDGEIRKMDDQ